MHQDLRLQEKIAEAAEWIRQAQSIVVAAGAGMGIDSGLPDYRGHEGFWRAYPALKQSRLKFESIASPDAFRLRPYTTWGLYGHRLNLYRNTQPHAGFGILQRWAKNMPEACFVFTSNVDGHFHKAGFPATHIYECHGSIHRLQCTANGGHLWSAADFYPQVDEAACQLQSELPLCPRCGALARPNILLFNDFSWNDLLAERQQMQLDAWLEKSPTPLVLEIGAGSAITTVRNFTQRMQQSGSKLIRINPYDIHIHNRQAIEIAQGAKQALEAMERYLTS